MGLGFGLGLGLGWPARGRALGHEDVAEAEAAMREVKSRWVGLD